MSILLAILPVERWPLETWAGRPFLPTSKGKPLSQMVRGFPTQEFVAGGSRVWPPLKPVISVEQGTDNAGHGAPIPPLSPFAGEGLDQRHVRRPSDCGMNVRGEESSIQKVCGEDYARPQNYIYFPFSADCGSRSRAVNL